MHATYIAYIILIIMYLVKTEPHLNINIFPVGEGDATIIECDDNDGGIIMTLVDAGSDTDATDEPEKQYYKFLSTKLNDTDHYLSNIILTSSDDSQSVFVRNIIEALPEDYRNNVKYYIAGSRDDYGDLSQLIFKDNSNVFEFTREVEEESKVSSCGHYPSNDWSQDFYSCFKRNITGPISNSNAIIDICINFQISIVAANYGGRYTELTKNSLVLKVSPTNSSSPSFLILGNFGNDQEEKGPRTKSYENLKSAHRFYTSADNNIKTLTDGLLSTVVLIPHHGANTYANSDPLFFSAYVQPDYAIVTSDVSYNNGNPRCSVLKNVHTSPSFRNNRDHWLKIYQCHSLKTSDRDDVSRIDGHDHIYQTTRFDPKDFPLGKLHFYLVSFLMTASQVIPPIEKDIFQVEIPESV